MRGDLFEVAGRFHRRQLPERFVISKIMMPISKAVAFLHANGVIHRDVKPENVVVMAGVRPLSSFMVCMCRTPPRAPALSANKYVFNQTFSCRWNEQALRLRARDRHSFRGARQPRGHSRIHGT